MSLIGYARGSTAEGRQVLDRQLDALNEAGCERVFEDRASGTASDRPKLAACLDYLRQGDVLVVLDLDRLGRRAGEFIVLIDALDHRGVGFRALNSPMDTTTPACLWSPNSCHTSRPSDGPTSCSPANTDGKKDVDLSLNVSFRPFPQSTPSRGHSSIGQKLNDKALRVMRGT